MDIEQSQLYKLHQLSDMLKSEAWSIYEEFINAYICQYIGSSLPRERLIGMKSAIEEIKKFTKNTQHAQKNQKTGF